VVSRARERQELPMRSCRGGRSVRAAPVTDSSPEMLQPRHIKLTVLFDSQTSAEHTLRWIAPELYRARLTMTDDHAEGTARSRTWAGTVDDVTFRRFASAWKLIDENGEPAGKDDDRRTATTACTLDGMNWEVEGRSPVVWASVQISPCDAAEACEPEQQQRTR
jgi:hypothetical protein